MLLTIGHKTIKIHEVYSTELLFFNVDKNGKPKLPMAIKRFSELKRKLKEYSTGAMALKYDTKEKRILWKQM